MFPVGVVLTPVRRAFLFSMLSAIMLAVQGAAIISSSGDNADYTMSKACPSLGSASEGVVVEAIF